MKTTQWPDWKTQAAYPATKNTTLLQWAWEFLRRNPEYQRLWQELIEPQYYAAKQSASWRKPERPGYRFRRRLNSHPRVPFSDKFHISTYPPPHPAERKAKLAFDAQFVRYQKGSGSRDEPSHVHGDIGEGEMVVWFDLRLPSATAGECKKVAHANRKK